MTLLKDKLFTLFDEYANSSTGSNPATKKYCNTSQASNVEEGSNPLMEDFDQSDLELYLEENKLPRVENYNVLGYWNQNKSCFPVLYQMARDVLAILLSTVASESAFSVGGRVLDAYRSSLTPQIVKSMICLRDWLFGQEALMRDELNLDDLCGDVMKVNLHDDEDNSLASKNEARSGVGQQSALETAF